MHEMTFDPALQAARAIDRDALPNAKNGPSRFTEIVFIFSLRLWENEFST